MIETNTEECATKKVKGVPSSSKNSNNRAAKRIKSTKRRPNLYPLLNDSSISTKLHILNTSKITNKRTKC